MEDDWCLLSDDEEFVSIASPRPCTAAESELEPEPETSPTPQAKTRRVQVRSDENRDVDAAISLDDIDISTLLQDSAALRRSSSHVATRTSALPVPHDADTSDIDAGISLDDIDISTLLQDSAALRTHAPLKRAATFSLSLLSPEHRSCRSSAGRCVESAHSPSRKRGGTLAFSAPRIKSFPARLRAEMPSRRSPVSAFESPPVLSPLVVFARDQSTQCDADDLEPLASTAPEPRAVRLASALTRSLDLSHSLTAKAQDHERLSLKLMQAEAREARSERRHERDVFKLGRLESGLEIAKSREKRYVETQARLEAQVRKLRQQNAELARAGALLAGDAVSAADTLADAPAAQSIDDLERLETSLASATDAVRAAVRAKYKLAIARQQQPSGTEQEPGTTCVVCLAKPATVVLVPCLHQVLCSACAVRVTTCPVDREAIDDRVLAFGLNAYKA
ncbi:hypothetical protein PybrP1_002955 [[Pythium] brassicae (nom. inval.)]|nr:hypothetical protein PybrP1_002955 [[Pythium] brassicae (nom. inval.)]